MSAALTGAAVAVAALATPGSADDVVPGGCVGSVVYACTDDARPRPYSLTFKSYSVDLTLPQQRLLPGATVGGQQVGGVLIPVPGTTTPGFEWRVDVSRPTPTGVVVPIQVCAFVTCIPAGTPVAVPGIPAPVVPVSIPPVNVPGQTVVVPALATVPVQSIPEVATPAIAVEVLTITAYTERGDVWDLAAFTCAFARGNEGYVDEPRWRRGCMGGEFPANAVSNALYTLYYDWPFA